MGEHVCLFWSNASVLCSPVLYFEAWAVIEAEPAHPLRQCLDNRRTAPDRCRDFIATAPFDSSGEAVLGACRLGRAPTNRSRYMRVEHGLARSGSSFSKSLLSLAQRAIDLMSPAMSLQYEELLESEGADQCLSEDDSMDAHR